MVKAAEILGITFDGRKGKMNSIVDVPGVEVGHETLNYDLDIESSKRISVRTGVTAIIPAGKENLNKEIFSGVSVLNGNGESTGFSWISESGMLSGPVMLTSTYSVGLVRDAVLKWMDNRGFSHEALPVVLEISDEFLNDIKGHHITDQHVFSALDKASSTNMEEGNVGGGTGSVCYEFKGGIGTSSRIVQLNGVEYTVGVMVQSNHGLRHQFQLKGIPVGRNLTENLVRKRETGSIVFVIATDAPLLPHQLTRLSKRAYLGLARTGSVSSNGSGDFSIAFSTAGIYEPGSENEYLSKWIGNAELDPLFEGVVQATEEAIVNSLLAAETMSGNLGHKVLAIPRDKLKSLLR